MNQIAISQNTRKEDFRGLPRESVEEYLSRGGEIKRIPWTYREESTRRVFPIYRPYNGYKLAAGE